MRDSINTTVNGYTLTIHKDDEWFTRTLLGTRGFEPVTTKFLKDTLKPGMTFVDVGAHVGYFTLLASSLVGSEGKVFAFEPHPDNFELLQLNITANHASNVMAWEKAAAAMPGGMQLYSYGDDKRMYHSLTPQDITHPHDAPTGEAIRVETVLLDDMLPDKVDVVKIDVEGAEPYVLRGFVRLLQLNPDMIVIAEDHKGEAEKWLRGQGFDMVRKIKNEKNIIMQRGHAAKKTEKPDRPIVAAAPSHQLGAKHRFHILAVPHTKTTPEYTPCAFTMKVLRWCEMMTKRGHTVIHYGAEGSTPVCTEHVDVLSDEVQQRVYGHVNWHDGFFEPNRKDEAYTTFQANAVAEIKKRAQPGDFVVVSMGLWHKPITDQLNGMMCVELGIGYEGCYLPQRIFESYAWMNFIYGKENPKHVGNVKWYDTAIPMYFNADDFPWQTEKEPYFAVCGRMIQRKGFHIAQQVVDRLVAEGIKVRLKVAGQGDPWKCMDKSPNVDYLGVVGFKERSQLLSRAAGTFVPTVYLEPFGHVVVESYLSGTPVITTDGGAFTETVLHGVTGYRCHTFDQFVYAAQQCLAGAINPSHCRSWAETNYSYERVGSMYEEYFSMLADLKTPSGWYTTHPERHNMDWLTQAWPSGVGDAVTYGQPLDKLRGETLPCR